MTLRPSHHLALLLAAIVLASPALRPAFADECKDRIDEVFAAFDKPDSPGCAVAVLRRGKVIHQRGYGRAHLEWDSPITPATVFPVASVSKQFTALAVALLAEQGKLSLDDDVLATALAVSPSMAYIHFPPPTMQMMCKIASNIRVLTVKKHDKEKGVIIYDAVEALKGNDSKEMSFKHAIPKDAAGAKPIFDWVADASGP